jgi:hypothetical protein
MSFLSLISNNGNLLSILFQVKRELTVEKSFGDVSKINPTSFMSID